MSLPLDRAIPLTYQQRRMFRRFLVRRNQNILRYALATDQITDAMVDIVTFDMLKEFNAAKNAINAQIADFMQKYGVDKTFSLAEAMKYNRLAGLEMKIDNVLEKLTDYTVKATRGIIEDVYQESFYRHAFGIQNSLEVGLSFSLLPEKQILGALANPMDRIGWGDRQQGWIDRMNGEIRSSITQGIIQGESYTEIANKINERTGMALSRADTIVRTETNRARSLGNQHCLEHAARQGVDMMKVWIGTLDDYTRDTHRVLDQEEVPMFDQEGRPGLFLSRGGWVAERPQGFGVAEEDINCRCSMRGHVNGFRGPSARWARAIDGKGEFMHYDTYEEYAKERGWATKADDLGVFDKGKAVRTVDEITVDFVESLIQGHENSIYHEPNEWAIVLAPDGTHIRTHTSGFPDRVDLGPLVKDNLLEGNILTHNHPPYTWVQSDEQYMSGSLSQNDIVLAIRRNVAEMRAVGHDGRIYSMKPDPEFWFSDIGQAIMNAPNTNPQIHFESWHRNIYIPFYRDQMHELNEHVAAGVLDKEEAAHMGSHITNMRTLPLLGFQYEQRWSDWVPEHEKELWDYTSRYRIYESVEADANIPASESMYSIDEDGNVILDGYGTLH